MVPFCLWMSQMQRTAAHWCQILAKKKIILEINSLAQGSSRFATPKALLAACQQPQGCTCFAETFT